MSPRLFVDILYLFICLHVALFTISFFPSLLKHKAFQYLITASGFLISLSLTHLFWAGLSYPNEFGAANSGFYVIVLFYFVGMMAKIGNLVYYHTNQ